jgi:hypothetical protein
MRLTGRHETTAKCCVCLLFPSRSQLVLTATSLTAEEQLSRSFLDTTQMFFSDVFPTLHKLLRQELTDFIDIEVSFLLLMVEAFGVQHCITARLSTCSKLINHNLESVDRNC